MQHKTYARHGSRDYNSVTAAGCEADGEPVFTLRAQDKNAAATVRFWADQVERADGDAWFGEDQKRLVAEARAIASDMDAWPDKKVPD